MRTILIQDLIGRDVLNRISAHDIFSAVYSYKENDVDLDFSGVQFTTRSFMDEFYNELKKSSESGINVSVSNMSDDLRQMYLAVSRTQKSGTKEITLKPYSRPKTISDLEQIFSSMSI